MATNYSVLLTLWNGRDQVTKEIEVDGERNAYNMEKQLKQAYAGRDVTVTVIFTGRSPYTGGI